MRASIAALIRFLQPPGVVDPDESGRLLAASYDPVTVSELLKGVENNRAELIEWLAHVDRKLLAVMTAGGVYSALLVSIRAAMNVWAVAILGLFAVAGIAVAYNAWRPHSHFTVPLSYLIEGMNIELDDLRRVLVIAYSTSETQIRGVIGWKVRHLGVASWCLMSSTIATMIVTVVGELG